MAKALNHDNPYKFVENNENGHIRRDRPLKSEKKAYYDHRRSRKKKEQFYDNLSEKEKETRARGKDFEELMMVDGILLPTAIKVQMPKTNKPPYWIGINKHCQIYIE